MRPITGTTKWLAMAGMAVTSFACSNTADGVREDATEARQEAREQTAEAREEAAELRNEAADAAERGGNAVSRAGDEVADAARSAARETGEAVRSAGSAVGGAVETMDVKTALMTDDRVDASNINVDTNHAAKTVTLKGRVPTATQKATAEQIAAKQATGYRIVNQLTVPG
jgi:osmotically-inducible protein OsmY